MDLKRLHNDIHEGALQLIAEHRERLFAKAKSICANDDEADELVIRTIDRAIRKVNTYTGEGDILSWMMTILENIHHHDCRNPVIRGSMAVSSEEMEKYVGADWGTDEEILRNSDGEAVRAALKNLDPEYKEVLILRYYEDLSLKEIAAFLNKPVGTIGRRIHVALKLLVGMLGAKMGKTKKPLAVILVVLLSLVSAAAVATLPAFEPLRETVSSWFESDAAPEEGIRSGGVGGVVGGGGVSPAQMGMRPSASPAVGRNDPCPCGSGKKYKKCCGKGLV